MVTSLDCFDLEARACREGTGGHPPDICTEVGIQCEKLLKTTMGDAAVEATVWKLRSIKTSKPETEFKHLITMLMNRSASPMLPQLSSVYKMLPCVLRLILPSRVVLSISPCLECS